MKKIISLVLCLSMFLSAVSLVYADNYSKFTDVPQDSWYYNDVYNAVELGIINGKSENTFAPEDNLTYAEAIKLAACMYQLYKEGSVYLVSGGSPWYQTYVDYCKSVGVISKEYNYNENATRAGYMEIFADSLPSEAYSEINTIPDGSIKDVKDDSPYSAAVY